MSKFWSLTLGETTAFFKGLQDRGVTPNHITRGSSFPEYLDVIAAAAKKDIPGFYYSASDVCHFLGLKNECSAEKEFAPVLGEIALWHGPWSPYDLKNNVVVLHNKLIASQNWFEVEPWYKQKSIPSRYCLRVGIPGSSHWDFEVSLRFLSGEVCLPVSLGMNAWIVHKMATGKDLFQGKWIYCNEVSRKGERVMLHCASGDRLCISTVPNSGDDDLAPWMAGFRVIS